MIKLREKERNRGGVGKRERRGKGKTKRSFQGRTNTSGKCQAFRAAFCKFQSQCLNEHLQTPMVSLRFHFRGAFVISSLDNFTLKLTFSPKFTGLTILWNFPQLHMLLPAPLPVFSSGSFSYTLGDNADMLWDSSSAFSMHTTLP